MWDLEEIIGVIYCWFGVKSRWQKLENVTVSDSEADSEIRILSTFGQDVLKWQVIKTR